MIEQVTSRLLQKRYAGYKAYDSRRFKVLDSHFPEITDMPLRWRLKVTDNNSGVYIWVQLCQSSDDDKWYLCTDIWQQSFQMYKGKKRRFVYTGLHQISAGFDDFQEAEVYLILKFAPTKYNEP